MNATVTMNLFGVRITPSIWVAVTIAMMAIGVMAAAVPEALTERAGAFAIGNAVIRIVWAWPWLLKRRTTGVPWWRPVAYSFVPAALWVVSVWVPAPWQYVLWAIAVAIEIVLLSFLGGQRTWLRQALDVDHLIERVGLLVVIVFGESILAIIAELDAHWTPLSGIAAVLGFAAVSMLAWIFFGYATSAVERGLRRLQLRGSISGLRDTVMYLPFLLVAGIALFAAGLGTAVADAGHHLPIGAAVCLSAGVSLFFIASTAESLRYGAPWGDVVMWGPAGILLPWLLVPLSTAVGAEVRGGGIRRCDRCDGRAQRDQLPAGADQAEQHRSEDVLGVVPTASPLAAARRAEPPAAWARPPLGFSVTTAGTLRGAAPSGRPLTTCRWWESNPHALSDKAF